MEDVFNPGHIYKYATPGPQILNDSPAGTISFGCRTIFLSAPPTPVATTPLAPIRPCAGFCGAWGHALTATRRKTPMRRATLCIWTNSSNPSPPFTNFDTADCPIQDAVDAAQVGDLVLVTNGVYATGGRAEALYFLDQPGYPIRIGVEQLHQALAVGWRQFPTGKAAQFAGHLRGRFG